jgi:DNA-binding NarL/FixJ family response regulator
MVSSIRILVVDDDELALAMLRRRLSARFPDLAIETTTNPTGLGKHDAFLIDNEFGGVVLGPTLGRELRQANPDALIVAFSSTLDADSLKGLLNAGCDGACDKSDPADFERLCEILCDYQLKARTQHKGVGSVLRSMADLLRMWNSRLDLMERR